MPHPQLDRGFENPVLLAQASQRAVAYAATQIAQPGDTIHLLCVLLDTTLADDHFARRTYVS